MGFLWRVDWLADPLNITAHGLIALRVMTRAGDFCAFQRNKKAAATPGRDRLF
jgi:hypothetical protein